MVRRLQIGFRSTFVGSVLAFLLMCGLPSSRILICVGDLNACSLISMCVAFEQDIDVSRFGVGVGVFNFVC
jgi:hypothetical protein